MKNRGFTLIEVLVAAGLLALLTTVCIEVWLIMSRMWTHGSRQTTLQQTSITLTHRLQHDVQAAKPGSIILNTAAAPNWTVSFLSYEGPPPDWSPTGDLYWKKWVQYRYLPSTQIMEREDFPFAVANYSSTPAMTAADVPAWSTSDPGTVVARSLAACNATVLNGHLNLDIVLQDQTNTCATRLALYPEIYEVDPTGL